MLTPVLLAIPGGEEAELVTRLDAPGSAVRVMRRCADVTEVLGAALAGLGRVAVLDARLAGIDRPLVQRLADAGVAALLIAEAGDTERCHALGATAVVEHAAGPAAWAHAVLALLPEAVASGEAPAVDGTAAPLDDAALDDALHSAGGRGEHPATAGHDAGADGKPDATSSIPASAATKVGGGPGWNGAAGGGGGRVVTVWGPRGSPGRTTMAINLAAELADLAGSSLLIDADTEAPSISQVLGLLDDSAGLAAASRLAAHGRLTAPLLAEHSLALAGGTRVVTGLSRPDRWRELTPAALDVVWRTARELAPWTVVDTAAGLDDVPVGFESAMAPRRHQATGAALQGADVIVVVGGGDPVGMHRLVQGLGELDDVLSAAATARHVVVNRVRSSAAGSPAREAILEALARFAATSPAALVPEDQAACDRAVLRGATLAEVAPGSDARAAVRDLAHLLTGVRARRRRGWRLPVLRRAVGQT